MPVFLYTDIEDSTQLWEHHRDAMGAVFDRHDELLMECVSHFGGRYVKNTGDGLMVIFPEGDGYWPAPGKLLASSTNRTVIWHILSPTPQQRKHVTLQ